MLPSADSRVASPSTRLTDRRHQREARRQVGVVARPTQVILRPLRLSLACRCCVLTLQPAVFIYRLQSLRSSILSAPCIPYAFAFSCAPHLTVRGWMPARVDCGFVRSTAASSCRCAPPRQRSFLLHGAIRGIHRCARCVHRGRVEICRRDEKMTTRESSAAAVWLVPLRSTLARVRACRELGLLHRPRSCARPPTLCDAVQ